ncbi:hypothetical protein E2C01_035055 [Portunus trituberculatus]|uniref:Uncharacterized protein n=1 Tax=Portunus trituberculatus TaxID=210409 RepID=A0A5B7F8P8_PORTR|nr:hypothetical protein [Portunus trituberculatus]
MKGNNERQVPGDADAGYEKDVDQRNCAILPSPPPTPHYDGATCHTASCASRDMPPHHTGHH